MCVCEPQFVVAEDHNICHRISVAEARGLWVQEILAQNFSGGAGLGTEFFWAQTFWALVALRLSSPLSIPYSISLFCNNQPCFHRETKDVSPPTFHLSITSLVPFLTLPPTGNIPPL